jgi:hypothetical protein
MSSTDTSNIFQNSYNDLQSEISSQESPSIIFGSSEVRVDKLPVKPVKEIKKIKLFNFKYKKEDDSYKAQNTSEQIQYILDNEKAIQSEENNEISIIKTEEKDAIDSMKAEEKSELERLKDEQEYQKKLDNIPEEKSIEIIIPEINTPTESDYESTNEQESSDLMSNLYHSEPIDINKISEISHYEPDYGTDTDTTPKDDDNDTKVEEKSEPDPNEGKTFSDMWKSQVDNYKRSSGGDASTPVTPPEFSLSKKPLTPAEQQKLIMQKLNSKYDNFIKTKKDTDINGIDTILGFFTIITDSVSTIVESVLFYCKKALRYVKGDTRWNTGIGRIFIIFMFAIGFFIILKYLF